MAEDVCENWHWTLQVFEWIVYCVISVMVSFCVFYNHFEYVLTR